jgi:GTP cyclohydrolase II
MTAEPAPVAPDAAAVRSKVPLPLRIGGAVHAARAWTFSGLVDTGEHLALELGPRRPGEPPLVRMHSECLTGDVLGSARCDCGDQLQEAMSRLALEGGLLLYLRQEGRGIGLYNKLDTYLVQDRGADTFAANRALGFGDDERDYTVAAQMLAAMGQARIRLLTNSPDKVSQLSALGVTVVDTVRTGRFENVHNVRYLAAKGQHARHRW